MIPTLIISVITFILIALSIIFLPKIKLGKFYIDTYWIISLLGALILLIANLAPAGEVWSALTSSAAINPIKILVLFFSMTLMSILLDEFGLFAYLAQVTIKKAKSSQHVLFLIIYMVTGFLTIFTSNDIVILTFTPFICLFARKANVNPLPYLIGEFVAANTYSLMFMTGNPTNIYLATSAEISFIEYFKIMIIPTLFAGIAELLVLFALFHKTLKKPIEVKEEECHLENKVDVIIGVIHLIVCLIFLIISNYITIEMRLICLICATSLLIATLIMRIITKKNWKFFGESFKRLPYPLIIFFISMCIIVVALNSQGISNKIAEFLNIGPTITMYGFSSLICSNFINNIPMSILYSSLVTSLNGLNYYQAVYATIIGSNIGAFLTPIGALAGIMFSSLLNKYEYKLSFLNFVKYGILIALPTISAALVGLFIVLH